MGCQFRVFDKDKMEHDKAYLLPSMVAPSISRLTSRIRDDSRSSGMSSLGFRGPKTSITVACTFFMISLQPRWSNHQLNVRNLRLVSKSFPYDCSTLSSSRFSRLMVGSWGGCDADDTTLNK